jgi:type II secretory pathway pseudopilin PulG
MNTYNRLIKAKLTASRRERSGTTLTEVLMSLMIMSIGIVLVATLFPVSTMRALDANRATNSTIARHVAEALTDIDPLFVHDPDGTFPDLGPGSPAQTSYNDASYGRIYNFSPPSFPKPPTLAVPYQGVFGVTTYIVDPLGWQTINQDSPMAAPSGVPVVPFTTRDYFGNSWPTTVTLSMPRRYNGASLFPFIAGTISPYPSVTSPAEISAAVIRASRLVTQPDNWKLVTETQGTATGSSIVSVILDSDADLSSVDPAVVSAAFPSSVYRAVIFNIDGSQSEVRYLTGISSPGITWGIDAPLPSRFEGGNIGKVRVEVSDEIYTWMLSVRKRLNGKTDVDVVVFFKRAIADLQEQVYDAAFRPNSTVFSNPDNRVTVNFTTTEPVLKRGGYIFDTANGLWYRIAKIENETGSSADLLLDETIKQANTEDLNGNGTLDAGEDTNGDTVIQRGGAILHPQVVNVFPLQIKEP